MKPQNPVKKMKTECPFCQEPYEIDNEHLDRHLECYNCHSKFKCMLVAVPKIGTMYLDIESTDDPVNPEAEVSSIVWWCNNKWFSWVKGKDKPDEFLMFWEHAPWVVTFRGKAFEEPLVCRQFNVSPHQHHIELREEAKKQGMSGGLKALGEVFGLPRAIGLDKVDGETSIDLWKRFEKDGSTKALDNLMYCNAWDVVLIYHLHCYFSKIDPIPMQNTIPFIWDPGHMKPLKTQTGSTPPEKAPTVKSFSKPPPLKNKPVSEAKETPKKVITLKKSTVSTEKKILIKKPV